MLNAEDDKKLRRLALLKHPDFYYELPAISLESNFANYPGQLIISRALKGKAKAFRVPGIDHPKKKRTIIISDFSLFKTPNILLREASIKLIEALIIEGF